MIETILYILLACWLLRFTWDNIILVPINYIRELLGKEELPRIKKLKPKKK